ncbi:hypothetical protein OXX79_005007 [Metschnikowia pulcherrima]
MPPKPQENGNGEKFTSFRFTQSEQDKRIAQKVRMGEKISRVVLDYLVQEGFQASALKLSQEAGIPLKDGCFQNSQKNEMHRDSKGLFSGFGPSSVASEHDKGYVSGYGSIERRKQIKYLILRGDVAQAIKVISTYYPTVLDANNLLLFKLLRLNLIEMIRNHKASPGAPSAGSGGSVDSESDPDSEKQFLNEILTFVREHLLNKVTTSMDLLRQLEVTMSLLCFDFDHHKSAPQMTELPEELRNLLNLSLRNECYRAVNKVILDLDTTSPPEMPCGGTFIDEFGLKSAILNSNSHELPEIDDSDSNDVEIDPGPDMIKSIESMISAPDFSFHKQEQEEVHDTETGSGSEDTSTQSKLEAIAKLWLATESILVLEKFIPEKRYFEDNDDDDDDARCL